VTNVLLERGLPREQHLEAIYREISHSSFLVSMFISGGGTAKAVALSTPPTLYNDPSTVSIVNSFKVTFSSDPTWSSVITAVYDGETLLETYLYSISTDYIEFYGENFSAGVHTFRIKVDGYSDAFVDQIIVDPDLLNYPPELIPNLNKEVITGSIMVKL
jgi:hypothetical protein